jgi:hypothetical protein
MTQEKPDGQQHEKTARAKDRGEAVAKTRRSDRSNRRRVGGANLRQQPDAARTVPAADGKNARPRRPVRGAEAVDPDRHELPVLRGRGIFVHGEAAAMSPPPEGAICNVAKTRTLDERRRYTFNWFYLQLHDSRR